MRNVLGKSCRENQDTRFIFSNIFRKSQFYEIMSKNMVEPEGPSMTSQHGSQALHAGLARLPTHTSTRPGTHVHARTHHLILLIAFPQQQ